MTDAVDFGLANKLYRITRNTSASLFGQCEQAQLTFIGLEEAIISIRNIGRESFEIPIPLGYRGGNDLMLQHRNFPSDVLIEKFTNLCLVDLPQNNLIRLVTIVDSMFGDLLREIFLAYPKKIGAKAVSVDDVFSSSSIDEIQLKIAEKRLNEISYLSPKDFADSVKNIFSFDLMECPAYEKYLEIKATRDIHIHNQGIANEIYIRKANGLSRCGVNEALPITVEYFLESYEICLQLVEYVRVRLNDKWKSSDFDAFKMEVNAKNEVKD